jgi:Protein of unknown function (DUF4054)
VPDGAVQTVGPVTFDYAWFQRRYPELSEWVSPDMGQGYFDLATGFLAPDNSGPPPASPFWDTWSGGARPQGWAVTLTTETRQRLLGLLTAHVAALFAPLNGQPSPSYVGRISNASEGSVSVGIDFPGCTPNNAWYCQTKYGAMYWAATARYRTMRYHPGRQPFREMPFSGGVY